MKKKVLKCGKSISKEEVFTVPRCAVRFYYHFFAEYHYSTLTPLCPEKLKRGPTNEFFDEEVVSHTDPKFKNSVQKITIFSIKL